MHHRISKMPMSCTKTLIIGNQTTHLLSSYQTEDIFWTGSTGSCFWNTCWYHSSLHSYRYKSGFSAQIFWRNLCILHMRRLSNGILILYPHTPNTGNSLQIEIAYVLHRSDTNVVTPSKKFWILISKVLRGMLGLIIINAGLWSMHRSTVNMKPTLFRLFDIIKSLNNNEY